MQGLDWNDLRYLLVLSQTGRLVAAARRLGVDATTVARRLRAAEAALGARLFERRPDGEMRPTEAGRLACAQAEVAESAIRRLTGTIGAETAAVACRVRLTAVPILVSRVLIPAMGALTTRHPALSLDLVSEPRNLNLVHREADIALRLARPSPATGRALLARRIGRLDYGAYVAANFSTEGERALPWVGYDDARATLPQARWTAIVAQREGGRSPIDVSDAEALVSAVRGGLGRAILPRVIGDPEPGLRSVHLPAGVPDLPSREVWCLVHPDLRALPRISAVADWLAALFGRT